MPDNTDLGSAVKQAPPEAVDVTKLEGSILGIRSLHIDFGTPAIPGSVTVYRWVIGSNGEPDPTIVFPDDPLTIRDDPNNPDPNLKNIATNYGLRILWATFSDTMPLPDGTSQPDPFTEATGIKGMRVADGGKLAIAAYAQALADQKAAQEAVTRQAEIDRLQAEITADQARLAALQSGQLP